MISDFDNFMPKGNPIVNFKEEWLTPEEYAAKVKKETEKESK